MPNTTLAEFREMEKNHGWLPEHKERIEQFLLAKLDAAYAEGVKDGEQNGCVCHVCVNHREQIKETLHASEDMKEIVVRTPNR